MELETAVMELAVRWSLKALGGLLVIVQVLVVFAPALLVLVLLGHYDVSPMMAGAAAAIAWGLWLLLGIAINKDRRVQVVLAHVNTLVTLCFKSHDRYYFQ